MADHDGPRRQRVGREALEPAQPGHPVRREPADLLGDVGDLRRDRVVVAGLEAHHARRLGGAEADREDRAQGDRHLAEDLAGVAHADDPRDPVGVLDRLDPALEHREEGALAALVGRVLARDEADVRRRAGEPLALGGVERREERDPADLLRGDHGGILDGVRPRPRGGPLGPRAPTRIARLPRHFLTGAELSAAELGALLDRALELKAAPRASRALEGRSVALIFEQPSTRTRTSFEAGIVELGGHPMVLRPGELQLTRGESVRDTALVLSRHVAAIALRTGSEETLAELAEHAGVPVVNMLSPEHHPCQALADLLTHARGVRHARRPPARLRRRRQQRRALAGVVGALAGRGGHRRRAGGLPARAEGSGARLTDDPGAAAEGADVLYTDVWVSMSDDAATAGERRAALAPYRIDDALLDRAAPGAFALHCLPAHPGEEITAEVLYGDRASGSGTRRRTGGTRRRRCSSSWSVIASPRRAPNSARR